MQIFVLEGVITAFFALVFFFTLPTSPESTKWLNEEERELAVTRLRIEHNGMSSDKTSFKTVLKAMRNPYTWACCLGFNAINLLPTPVLVDSFRLFRIFPFLPPSSVLLLPASILTLPHTPDNGMNLLVGVGVIQPLQVSSAVQSSLRTLPSLSVPSTKNVSVSHRSLLDVRARSIAKPASGEVRLALQAERSRLRSNKFQICGFLAERLRNSGSILFLSLLIIVELLVQ